MPAFWVCNNQYDKCHLHYPINHIFKGSKMIKAYYNVCNFPGQYYTNLLEMYFMLNPVFKVSLPVAVVSCNVSFEIVKFHL